MYIHDMHWYVNVYDMYVHVCMMYVQYLLDQFHASSVLEYQMELRRHKPLLLFLIHFGEKPLSKASVCYILLPFVATGTGSLLSNECSLSKSACSWLSKPLIHGLMHAQSWQVSQ